MGDESSDIPRIDKVTKPNSSDNGVTTETYHLNWENRDTWYWTEFAEPLSINAKANGATSSNVMPFFPQVCYLYCALLPLCKLANMMEIGLHFHLMTIKYKIIISILRLNTVRAKDVFIME